MKGVRVVTVSGENFSNAGSTIVEELKQINHRAKCHGVFSISNKTRCFYLLQPAR